MAQAVKAKYAKHCGPYLGMDYSICAYGTGTHGGLEPDACRLSDFVTSLMLGRPSTSKNKASMVLGVILMSTSVLV